ncbi:zf-DHHC-domain-containing protein [Fomitiporia mediterranea MF3/22]|uniref:zf-DHHC-domain-containing protein n=1 Tax=Fomitiporia mediterranea (strain MF3/22) TaxID=694068 RepID=UPI00044083A6|nr:zf-DHHC-domain-containing protein [Fomitiporia mediterranea MF3/22]EJD07135.1 zf-DHHC-domain-containing protein [Fomitiporia mediterranea MF3/22]
MCSNAVFRCFRCLERTTDRVTGAAGPLFVTLAICLLCLGVFCFFEAIQPSIRWPLLTVPIDALIAFNLLGQYYLACTVKPGFIDDPPRTEGESFFWAKRRKSGAPRTNGSAGVHWSEDMQLNMTRAHVSRCKRCGQIRPERAHHCRICNHCVLKYDHHCPVQLGINQCVGLYNERHFVLFMAYLVLSTFCFAFLGYEKMWEAMGFTYTWTNWTPEIMFSLIYILSLVLCFAVGVMLSWHVWSICKGETSVESHDHDVYRKTAKERGQVILTTFICRKLKNLELFFNLGSDGYPYRSLLFPLRVMPYTDGRTWARRPGYVTHKGIQPGDELTDEDDIFD